jgi:hypothetical protein
MATNANLYSVIQGLSPLLHYPLTETSGTTLVNSGSLGTACNATLAGSYTLADRELISGDPTKFLKLTGGRASGSRGAMSLPVTNMTFSVLLEVLPNTPLALPPGIFSILATGETEATNAQVIMSLNSTTLAPFSLHENGAGVNNVVTSTETIAAAASNNVGNTLLHLTVTRNATTRTVKFYYNGGLLFSDTYTTNPTGGTSAALFIGTEADLRPSHPMAMGQLCLWNRVLSDSELFNLHSASGYNTRPSLGYLGLDANPSDVLNIATISPVLSPIALKRLRIAYDALMNPNIINPEEAYTFD